MRSNIGSVVRTSIWLLPFITLLVSQANDALAQEQASQKIQPQQPPVIANPAENSPLSLLVPEGVQSLGANLFQQQLTSGIQGNVYVTKNVDLSDAITKYAAIKNVSKNESFAKIVGYLGLLPLQNSSAVGAQGATGFFKVVTGDTYQIMAPAKFFEELPQSLLVIENGIQKIVIEARFVYVPVERIKSIQRFMIADSFQTFNNRLSVVEPIATHAVLKNAKESTVLKPIGGNATGTFASATETRTKIYPTFLGRFERAQFDDLLRNFSDDESVEVTMAPRLLTFASLPVSLSDAESRPFVVGVNMVASQSGSSSRPIIQPIEDGVVIKVRASLENGKIRLDGDLALSEVLSVETFGYSNNEGEIQNVTLQVPEHRLRQVHWSTLVEDGKVIMVDPVFTKNVKVGEKKKIIGDDMEVLRKKRMIVFISPRMVDYETDK